MENAVKDLALGAIVTYHFPPTEVAVNNFQTDAPAVVVRIWSPNLLNLKVLVDGPEDLWITSVYEGTEGGQWSL